MATKRKPGAKRGRPTLPEGEALKLRAVRLSDEHWDVAADLGCGKVSAGIRRALDFALRRRKKPVRYTVGENEHGWHVYAGGRILCSCKSEDDAHHVAAALDAYRPSDGE